MHTDWQQRIEQYQSQAKQSGVVVTDPEAGKTMKYLGLQLFIHSDQASKILNSTKSKISPAVLESIHWQEPNSLHLTIQSTLFNDSVDVVTSTEFIDALEAKLKTINSIECEFMYPYFTQTGLIGIVNNQEYIYSIRQEISEVWGKYQDSMAVPTDYWDFPHSFLGRFTHQIPHPEIESLINISQNTQLVTLQEIRLCFSDKFISTDTVKVVSKFHLQ